jgi:hypothetical protein
MILEILGFGAAALLVGKAVGWAKDSDKLIITTKGRVQKITFSKITIAVTPTVKNPTNHAYKFKHPFVTLEYKKQTIGTSNVEDYDYSLDAFKQMTLKEVMIEISILSLPTLAVDIFHILQTQKGAAPILIRTIVPVEVAGQIVSVPYEQTINL